MFWTNIVPCHRYDVEANFFHARDRYKWFGFFVLQIFIHIGIWAGHSWNNLNQKLIFLPIEIYYIPSKAFVSVSSHQLIASLKSVNMARKNQWDFEVQESVEVLLKIHVKR